MISASAKERFLSRELASYDWIKKLTDRELDEELASLDPPPKFYTKPWKHQKACFLLTTAIPRFIVFGDMGVGKTKLMADVIRHWKSVGKLQQALVLVPNVVAIENWIDDLAEHAPDLKPVGLVGSKTERKKALKRDADLFILNYAGFVALCSTLEKQRGKKKRKRVLSDNVLDKFSNQFQALILDECQAIKSHMSLTYQACKKVSATMPIRYGLTGTPFGRDPLDLWSQFYVVDRGETLGYTLGMFRECLFTKRERFWGGFDYKFKRKYTKLLNQWLQNRSIRYSETECADLPPKVYVPVRVVMPLEAEEYYREVIKEIRAEHAGYKALDNAFLRARQIASGYLGLKNALDDSRIELEFSENPKLEALMELVGDLPHDSKMVIFHEYTWSGRQIEKTLRSRKIKFASLRAEVRDKAGELRKFKNDETCRFFVVNSQSGGTSLNLQRANYVCFYESPVSPIVRKQAEKRCHRPGQTKRTFFYDIYVKNSVEERILDYLRAGEDLFQALLDKREKL